MFLMRGEGWRRAGFELVIVFFGVFVALLVDGWNERRVEKGLEQDYLHRLSEDVARDSAGLVDLAQALDTKIAALQWLTRADPETIAAAESHVLIPQLVHAHTAGFGVMRGISTTFEDLRSTGNLGLIRDPDLRAQLIAYYEAWEFNADRVEARRSPFPSDIYSILPPVAYDPDVYFDAPASTDGVKVDREALSNYLFGREGRRALVGEMNYARFFAGVIRDLLSQSQDLLATLN